MLLDLAVNGFIVFFLIFAWCWNLPQSYLAWRVVFPFRDLIMMLGLDHNWAMFAPNPLHENLFAEAEIHFSDGEVLKWEGVRLDRMGWFEGIFSIRDRKWNEYLATNGSREVLLGQSLYLAERYKRKDGTLPSWIVILRNRQVINLEWAPHPNPAKEDDMSIGRSVVSTFETATGDFTNSSPIT